jgi:predicted nucleotidyltransferase component of viral defense system
VSQGTADRQLSDYRTPEALWAAVDTRIEQLVVADPRLTKGNLQRQFVYERLLARVFRDTDEWVLKGGTALLARVRSARHSKDVDLFRLQGTVGDAVAKFKKIAASDLRDHFRFVAHSHTVRDERAGQRATRLATVSVDGYAGATLKARFGVDIVIGSIITREPETLVPEPVVHIGGMPAPRYLLYPIVDHVADKVCATFERFGSKRAPSSRVRDLVDLVVIARTQTMHAHALRQAIEAERLHRQLAPITHYAPPTNWRSMYATAARGVVECVDHSTYAAATGLMERFLNPVLANDPMIASWRPEMLQWSAVEVAGYQGRG